jgi:hypothetical protein
MKRTEKPFDAVQMMRQIRDRLSDQCKHMAFDQQREHIRERLGGKPTKGRPGAQATQPSNGHA